MEKKQWLRDRIEEQNKEPELSVEEELLRNLFPGKITREELLEEAR